MVYYFIYAKDFSSSTYGNRYYHKNGKKTLRQFKEDVKNITKDLISARDSTEMKIIYLHWGSHCYEVSKKMTKQAYDDLDYGFIGTYPETIIEWIQQTCNDVHDKIKLLYIITDGCISSERAQKCFELNENMYYESFIYHVFNEDLDDIDLSVVTFFMKHRCMIYINNELHDDVLISKEFDYDKINIENFATEKESIKSYIELKYIEQFKHNAHALQEINKLKKLRARLFEELSSKPDNIDIDLETSEKNQFIRAFKNTNWYQNLNATSQVRKVDIEKAISTLINHIVSETKSYTFDMLKFDTNFDNTVEEEPINVNFTAEQEIEFPDIILDDDKGIPVIILAKFNLLHKIIFRQTNGTTEVSRACFNRFRSIMDCPLYLLKDSDVSESIGYFYTLNVYIQLLAGPTKSEPRTRRNFHGGLVLTGNDEFDKYNDYILSATYFDARKVHYNIGLFYYVLWKFCDSKEWMDKNVVARFEKYVMRRINETTCKIGLSSLPLDPPQITSLPTALWYCVELSSIIFKNDPVHFMRERLRGYDWVAQSMIEILMYFGYELDLNRIEKRIDFIKHVTILKRIPQYKEKVYYLLQKIFKNENDFLVCEIEKPDNLYKLNYLKCDHKGVLDNDVLEEKVSLNDFVHLMHSVDSLTTDQFEICETNVPPFFTCEENKTFYTQLINNTKRVVINDDEKDDIKITFENIDSVDFDKILSLFNLFLKCVKDSRKYPTLSEYVEYISKKKKFNKNLVTIFPTNFYNDVEIVYSRCENIMSKVDVSKFLEVCGSYASRFKRTEFESIVEPCNAKELETFISSQLEMAHLKNSIL